MHSLEVIKHMNSPEFQDKKRKLIDNAKKTPKPDQRELIEITDAFRDEIRSHIDIIGMESFCREANLSKSIVYKYLNKTQTRMFPGKYKKLCEYLNGNKYLSLPQEHYVNMLEEIKALKDQLPISLTEAEAYCEKHYPQTTLEFKKIQQEMYQLFCEKQMDYGPENIKAGTKLETEEDRDWSLTGLAFRINDKVQRLPNLLKTKKNPNNESIWDTLIDLANYGVIGLIVKRGKWAK